MAISPARVTAFEVLMRVEHTDAYASELLHSSKYSQLSRADHGLATELVMGVLRWRSVLDRAIAKHSGQKFKKLDPEVLTSLRIGAYQVQFLDRVPTRAAIYESVELIKRARKRSAAGLVNAVLRKIDRAGVREASVANPEWLVEKWKTEYGNEAAQRICEYNQAPPQTAIRVQSSDASLEGLQLRPGRLLTQAATVTAGDVTRTNAFREHTLIIQDEGSQFVALLAGKGKKVLDCCAAPGGKTRILGQRNPASRIVAMELHPHRAALLRKLVSESNVSVLAADARTMPFSTTFDRVLVDAPCSGTGTLARNPEIKWRLKPNDLTRLQDYQTEILSAAMKQVAPEGRVIYSTCSLEPEENEQVVARVIEGKSEFQLLDAREQLLELQAEGELAWKDADSLLHGKYLRTVPGVHPCDGFFAAILERR